jgi:hypothetical protein
VNNMMWSTDNPHHGNDWPYGRKVVAEMMHTVDPTERYQMLAGNAMRIYHLEGMKASRDGAQRAVRVVTRQASRNGAPVAKKAAGRNGARAAGRKPARRAGARR